MAPTLCYQPSYPRTERIRKGFLAKRFFELMTLFGMMWFIAEQYSHPTLKNSLHPFANLNFSSLFERILKLSIPSIYIWLLMFYGFFHSYLNLWAELLRFGDREFYKPWWNASTIAQYWRLWNIPVYTFFKRHVYVPLRVNYPQVSRTTANAAAFFISAIGHEIVIGIPVHILQGWAFGGMLSQIPLIWVSEVLNKYEKQRHQQKRKRQTSTTSNQVDEDEADLEGRPVNFGNYLFWITFCIFGQPLCILLYYRAYYMRENPDLVYQAVRSV
jgi:diacylglycerol O-acyltransferase 1